MTGKVYLIGAGPGDPELMTMKAVRLLKEADVVVYDRLVSDEIVAMAPKDAKMIFVGKSAHNHPVPQDQINAILVREAKAGNNVARIKGGDPLIFGRGSEEAADLSAEGVEAEYVPGITAAQGAASISGVPLTHRDLATGVQYVTGHRARDEKLDLDWKRLADPMTTLVVYMGVANIGQIAVGLMTEGLDPSTPVFAISRATTPHERRMVSTLDRVAQEAREAGLKPPTLFIIGKVVSVYQAQQAELEKASAHG
ncbi:uroporphyrinogen-III C-methyltransferase [Aliiroseovarius sp. KMU-50]|uniref:uroporphyrinogen-III C-methyltransferase n=1 Tax=Aliiroseovarius salicola TaxID=3009082 RepID=A0ABT4VX27_9RHOB|nr:uroporphyrinogen-III C-methyltransferase [Aliiroseovarius sp. KMU-50]MDA5092804.1 uroporphyrinogen-III C-methyltransferase [Aliiroseovarius sp. KMU-50]